MKRIKSVLMCGLVLAFAGASTLAYAEGAQHAAMATVRAVHGPATYSVNGGQSMPLRPNMELPEGTTIVTGADATVDIQVNGRTSTVRVTANTQMTLKEMESLGSGDSATTLGIDNGQILGSVKKITKESHYEISTPRGVAGIRGTDFGVIVTPQQNGPPVVTFESVTGTIICVANVLINGVETQVSKTLTTGETWTPPATAGSVAQAQDMGLGTVPPGTVPPPLPPGVTVTTTGTTTTVTYINPNENPSDQNGSSGGSSGGED